MVLSTTHKKEHEINWLEVETSAGNFVLLEGHAPVILLVTPHTSMTLGMVNGKKETFVTNGGILDIRRTKATFFVYE